MPKLKLTDPFIRNHPAPEKRIEIYDSHIAGLALRITPTGHKSFVYRYRFNDRVKRYTIGSYPKTSLSEARDKAGKIARNVSDGIDPLEEKKAKKRQPDPQTFEEICREYKDKHLPTLKESTREEYQRIIDNELLPALGKYPIKEITKNQIISLLDAKAYKADAPTMANRIRARLSKLYSFALQRGLVEANLIEGVPTYSQGKTKRDRYYSEAEIKELWSHFNEQPEPTASVLKMLLATGQRKTETMHMKWSDIKNEVWTIPAELAKNNQPHDVPLSGFALEILEQIKPLTGNSEYVFTSPKKDNQPINWIKTAVRGIKKESSVSDFRPHDLRRTVATYMAKLGIDRTVLGKILNHKGLAGDGQVTAIYDRHSYLDEKRQAMNRWSKHLERMISEENEANIYTLGS